MKLRIKSVIEKAFGFSSREYSDVTKLRGITAAQIPLSEPSEIEIQDVRRGIQTISWRASYRGKNYSGHADGLFLQVTFTRIG
jgi:hypothetical protein